MPKFIDDIYMKRKTSSGDYEVKTIDTYGNLLTGKKDGNIYYVDPDNGSDSNDGLSWDAAFATMAVAFTTLDSGDTIYFHGKIEEQVTTPVQVFDVTIIGASNRPRHADSTPDGGQSGASWAIASGGSTSTSLITVLQQGWRFVNILFAGPSAGSCVQLYRDGGSEDAERDASHASFYGCRFASGQDGIEQSGGCFNVGIFDCTFHSMTGYAIKHTAGASIAAPYKWEIKNNRFQECANWMGTWDAHNFEIMNNTILETTTNLIDTSGGTYNVIVNNVFSITAASFDPTGHVTGDATDVWSNYLTDAIETGLPAD